MSIKGYRKVVALFGLTGFLNIFLFHAFGAPAFMLVISGIWIFLLAVLLKAEVWPNLKKLVLIVTLFLLGTGILLINRDFGFTIFLTGFSILAILGFSTYLLAAQIPFFRSLFEIIASPILLGLNYLFSGIRCLLSAVFDLPAIFKSKQVSTQSLFTIIIGLCIGLPIVIILVALLSKADPIFNHNVQQLFSFSFPRVWSTRIIFSTIIIVIFAPFMILSRKSNSPTSPIRKIESLAFIHEFTIVMGLVALTIGTFLVIQVPYVFVSVPFETDLSKFGVATYSEYVRRGFSELLFVGAIIYGLVWFGLLMFRSASAKRKTYLLTTQVLVLVEFAVFVLSLARRIWLYQAYHGLSLIRIYGSIFLVWLSLITIILALRHFVKKRWVMAEVGVTITVILFISWFNAEDFIARVHPPTVNKRIDYVYLSRMSADGYEGWKMAFTFSNEVLNERGYLEKPLLNREDRRDIAYSGMVLGKLSSNYHELLHKYGTIEEWRQYNLAIYNSLKTITLADEEYINNKPPSVAQIPYFTGKVETDLETISKVLKYLDDRINTLNQSLTQKSRDINLSYVSSDFVNDYNYKPCNTTAIEVPCLFSFFWYSPIKSSKWHVYQPGTFDYALAWNGSQSTAYEKIQVDMPIRELLQLQQVYFSLWYKINAQPKSERDYDIDVSFESPLLGD